jgi:hypothetical protein
LNGFLVEYRVESLEQIIYILVSAGLILARTGFFAIVGGLRCGASHNIVGAKRRPYHGGGRVRPFVSTFVGC